MEDQQYGMPETQVVPEQAVETLSDAQPLQTEEAVAVEEAPQPSGAVCESCGAATELFDVPHHQTGNPKVWKYCQRCKLAHAIEVTTNQKVKEVMTVNPASASDLTLIAQVRDQVARELILGE